MKIAPNKKLWNTIWYHSTFLRGFDLLDLWNASHHSPDFRYSRAAQISSRVDDLTIISAALSFLWIFIDLLLLPIDKWADFILMRLLVVMAFSTLYFWQHNSHDLKVAYSRLLILIAIPSVFYMRAMSLLTVHEDTVILTTGYEHFPFLLITVGAIFPLTLLEGLFLSSVVFVMFVLVKFYLNQIFTLEMLNSVWLLALLAGTALWTQFAQLQILLNLYRQATRDPLTNLFNRRILIEQLEESISNSKQFQHPLSVLLFDLDRFKRINDTYGHLTGDNVLCKFSAILEECLSKEHYLVGRYGGEEFLAILPDTTREEAAEVAETIRQKCHASMGFNLNHEPVSFTTSIGVSQWQSPETVNELLNRVDECLLSAKEHGRDCVIMSRQNSFFKLDGNHQANYAFTNASNER